MGSARGNDGGPHRRTPTDLRAAAALIRSGFGFGRLTLVSSKSQGQYAVRRRHPRADVRVAARLFIGSDPTRHWEAKVLTKNISVGGLFIETEFFLQPGQVLDLELRLPPQDRLVRVRGRVVRAEVADPAAMRGGLGVKFEQYFGDAEAVLSHFTRLPQFRAFAERHAAARRVKLTPEQLEQWVDLLSTWVMQSPEERKPLVLPAAKQS